MLGSNHILGRALIQVEAFFEPAAEMGDPGAKLSHPLQQADDVGRGQDGWEIWQSVVDRCDLNVSQVAIGFNADGAAGEHLFGESPQILDQRHFEHCRECPQLADGERHLRLECRYEPGKSLEVEPAVAVANELDRHRVDADGLGRLPRGDLGQLKIIRSWQADSDCEQFGLDNVEVVEQPLRSGHDRLSTPNVV